MRVKQRIPIILKTFKSQKQKKKFLEYLFKPKEISKEGMRLFDEHPMFKIDDYVKDWNKKSKEVKELWKEHPELRLTQVLVGLNITPNIPGSWFYVEEVEYLIREEILQHRDILFWVQRYDKYMNRLKKTKFILIRNMDTNHIKTILKDVEEDRYEIQHLYDVAFKKEIEIREDNK